MTWIGLWPHPNILMAQFVSRIERVPYLHLDYAEKGSLRAVLAADPTITLDQRFHWAQHIAHGLASLHRPDRRYLRKRPIVHCDLKPDNVVILGHNTAQISDLGLARAIGPDVARTLDEREPLPNATLLYSYKVAQGTKSGTPAYTAPEQWQTPDDVGPPADIYAYGLILSELFAGRHAYMNPLAPHSIEEWRDAHLYRSPRPLRHVDPDLPRALELLYDDCLAKAAPKRPTARQICERLDEIAQDEPLPRYGPPGVSSRGNRESRHIFWHNWAAAYNTFGRYSEALDRIDRAVALDPTAYYAQMERANVLVGLGRFEEAAEIHMRQMVRRVPPSARLPKRLQQVSPLFTQSFRESMSKEEQRSIAESMLEFERATQDAHPDAARERPRVNINPDLGSDDADDEDGGAAARPRPQRPPNGRGGSAGAVPVDLTVEVLSSEPDATQASPGASHLPDLLLGRARTNDFPVRRGSSFGQRLTDYAAVDVEVQHVAGGGFGLVFMGPDRLDNGTWYALKTLRPEVLARSPRARDLFVREALTWCGLWPHANLLTAHSVTEINGQPFLVLDYAEHGSLRDLLQRRSGPFPLALGLEWAQHIAAGLAALHTPDPALLRPEPLVHRDLKPENVLLNAHGFAQITDFGLAKAVAEVTEADPTTLALLADGGPTDIPDMPRTGVMPLSVRSQVLRTGRGVALGTPAYMAPEQWEDAAAASPPADLYAFGLILSELLAGRHALLDLDGGYDLAAWRQAHRAGEPRRLRERVPDLPDRVETLYQALLTRRAEDRPTAEQTLAELRAGAEVLGQAPYAVPEAYPHTPDLERTLWHNWAIAYLKLGLYPEALARCERALALEPGNPVLLMTSGNILRQLGHLEQALQVYDHALAVLPTEDHLRRKGMWNNRGAVLSEMGRYAEAGAAYAEALALMPNAADAWLNRAANEGQWGQAESEAGHADEAREHFMRGMQHAERALALDPSDAGSRRLHAALRERLARLGG